MSKSVLFWLFWILITMAIAGYFGMQILKDREKPDLLIGESSDGHYQIEMQCETCHTSPFGGKEVLQEACVNCHGEELKAALDSHPLKKFKDPRNADRVKILDARYCVTCHREHNPDITRAMGVTLPEDYCLECHRDVGEERESHKGLGFETCASAGCHNFHDNKALYENFLLKHAHEPDLTGGSIPRRELNDYLTQLGQTWPKVNAFAPPVSADDPKIKGEWQHSAHGRSEVACTNCHATRERPGEWVNLPDHTVCLTCHETETNGFLTGKHGMRLTQGMSAMTPGMARLPMDPDSAHRELTCNSCHAAHSDDTQFAATEACLGCHADEHSRAFKQSPHFRLKETFENGSITAEQTVTCATCHLPRMEKTVHGIDRIAVEHNQNATLRPNEKMIRPVCMNCHGLEFAIDALADQDLIRNNFNGSPGNHIRSIDMALERDKPTTF